MLSYLLPTYAPRLMICKGEGAYVWDEKGKSYLDFSSGIGVCSLGHCSPPLNEILQEQSSSLWHISNLFSHPYQEQLAEKIVKSSFDGKVFFCNSGTEANEGILKFAKKYASQLGKSEIICLKNSFHGRTLGSLTATGQEKHRKDFKPLINNFVHIKPNFADFKNACSKKTGAFLLELIQGEGGVLPLEKNFVEQAYEYCKANDILFLVDEIQTGMGRTGQLFSFQHFSIEPDAFSLAKALGNGFPIGAFWIKKRYTEFFNVGSHASTFGGGPLACRVALNVFNEIEKKRYCQSSSKKVFNFCKKILFVER